MELFGKNLRAFRKERRLTQTELASLVGVAPAYVSQIESSLRMPSLKVARRFAEALKVELPALLGTDVVARTDEVSDSEKLDMLRTVVRAIEREMDSGARGKPAEQYPGSVSFIIAQTETEEVRAFRFDGTAPPAGRDVFFRHDAAETLYCAHGSVRVQVGDQRYELRSGQVHRLDPGTPHLVSGSAGSVCVSTVIPAIAREDVKYVAAGEEVSSH